MWIEISVTAAVSVVLWYLSRYFDNRPGKRREQFLRTREIINSSRQVLMDKVRKHYGLGQEETLLHPEGYVFPQPVPLDKVKLNLQGTTIACLQLAYRFRAKLGIPCPDSEDEELAVNLSLDKFSV